MVLYFNCFKPRHVKNCENNVNIWFYHWEVNNNLALCIKEKVKIVETMESWKIKYTSVSKISEINRHNHKQAGGVM